MTREHFITVTIRSWLEEPDEYGTSWWCSQHSIIAESGKSLPIGPLFKSRHSRQRAESYVMREWADQLAKMGPLTTVVD